jgi:hypothetical protein
LRYWLKLWWLRRPRGSWWARWLAGKRGRRVGNYGELPKLIRTHAPGGSFADIGCMWGVNGAHAFIAEECGATAVKAVDVFGPTPEFEAEHARRRSRVEFILGDALDPATLARIGTVDTVLCAGVLYHLPSPFDLLVALRRICARTLILRTSCIPEVPGLPQAAVYFPLLDAGARKRFDLTTLGVGRQPGISAPFDGADGYGNWFWGLTPSAVRALARTAGFRVDAAAWEPFALTLICSVAEPAFVHRLPGEDEARDMGRSVSAAGEARPQ